MATRTSRRRLGDDLPEDADAEVTNAADTAQKGGSRGSSNQTGPGRGATRNSRSAIAGVDQGEQSAQKSGGTSDPIRGPLPPGATREDYVGGPKPHKTRAKGGTRGASGKKNEVV
jgi:hypothetical protein